MEILKKYWWLFLVFIIVTLVFVIKYEGVLEPLVWTDKPFEVLGQLAVKLIVVGALLDQLIAVFFPESEETQTVRTGAETTLRVNREKRNGIRKEILSERLRNNADHARYDTFGTLNRDLSDTDESIRSAQEVLQEINANRMGFVRVVAFAFSLVLAIAGVTVLTDFIEMHNGKGVVELNHKIMYYLDIILTAALLSGGTSGINQFFKVVRDSWKRNDVRP
nr:hypothetical protein [Allomuricauda sp.]